MEVGEKKYTLTGGYFLYQILECINAKGKRRGVNNGGVTQSNCFKSLILLGSPNEKIYSDEKTMREDTSKYKNCKLEPAAWMIFTEESYKKSLNALVESDYDNLLQRTIQWGETYLDFDKDGDWLGNAILEMLLSDENINPNKTEIYAHRDGTQVLLSDLVKEEIVYIQPLIIGVWHYLVNSNIPNDFRESSKNVKNGMIKRNIDNIGKNNIFNGRIRILNQSRKSRLENASLPQLFAEAVDMIAPEITGTEVPLIVLSGEKIALSDDEFSEYLSNVYDAFKEVKTLLFRQEPREFKSIYLPNDIICPGLLYSSKKHVMDEPNIEKLGRLKKRIIISGTGGLGKSMMMRHILLDAIEHYKDYKLVPIYIALKDYKPNKYAGLFEFIYEIFSSFDSEVSEDELKDVMASGRCLFLLDGLDEIKNSDRANFEKELEKMTNGYGDSYYLISSRPFTNYISFSRFTKLELSPFSKKQSVALINKLDMGDDEKQLKDKFAMDLEKRLYDTHKEFAENPLLLTIMLMTYKNHSNIPVKMHKFYSKAYDTLFAEHDAIKQGYVREYKTKLTQDRFAEYVDEFCFLSYQDENFDMTEEDCKEYFLQLEAYEEDQPEFTWKDFMDDLTDAVCLMYKEGRKYHFLHRSLQEYFCARYFYRQEESNLWDIAMFFDEMHTRDTDKTFPMLYDMKPRAVEEKVFIPFLENIFTTSKMINGKIVSSKASYPQFLQTVYPYILFDDGDVPGSSVTEPKSYIYKFMARQINGLPMIVCLDSEWEDVFDVLNEYVYYDPNYTEDVDEDNFIIYEKGHNERLVPIEEVSDDYREHIEEPEPVGWTYELSTQKLYEEDNEDNEFICCLIEAPDFPIYVEYKKMYEYYQSIIHQKSVHKTDLRNKLRKKNIRQLYVSKGLTSEEIRSFESNRGNSVKLNEMVSPWKTISESPQKVFELKTTYEFQSIYREVGKRSIEVSSIVHGIRIVGTTSEDNWKSESYMNNIVNAGKYECTAWFNVLNIDEGECFVQFLIIGGEITW